LIYLFNLKNRNKNLKLRKTSQIKLIKYIPVIYLNMKIKSF